MTTMDTGRSLRIHTILIAAVAILFSAMALFDIPVQFYWWEFFIDGKIVVLSVTLWFFSGNERFDLLRRVRPLFRFSWKKALFFFFLPAVITLISIGLGVTFSVVRFESLPNATTVILATLFDLPAIYFFSFTTVFVEEVVFRGTLNGALRLRYTRVITAVLGGILWMFYSIPDLFDVPDLSLTQVAVVIFSFGAVGMFCAALSLTSASVWNGYSFRVGMFAMLPILISSPLVESDSFFTTTGMIFSADGIIFSALLLLGAMIILRRHSPEDDGAPKEILLDYLPKSDNIKP